MARDDEIQAIVGGIGTVGLAVALLGEPAAAPGRTQAQAEIQRPSPSGLGWGTGLAIGAAGGLVVGFALGRHRRDHSSRSRP